MTTQFAEFHGELRSLAGDVLAKDSSWPALVDAGWTGLEVPESLGGAGASFTETAVVCEEIGRAAAATNYLGGVLAVGALRMTTSGDEVLGGIASGAARAAVVIDGIELHNGKLYGTAEFVPDAVGADRLMVVVVDGDEAVLLEATGLAVAAQPVVDQTRSLATVSADGHSAGAVLGTVDVQALRDRAAVAVACDSLGLAQAMLDATVSYAKVRNQFGRPIGSFQAVKHACADMMVSLAVSRQLVDAAVAAVAGDAESTTAAAMAASMAPSMAKAFVTGKAVEIVGKAMQLHGGIGYTWECGIHVYLKRAALNRSLFGSPAAHRERLSERYRSRSY